MASACDRVVACWPSSASRTSNREMANAELEIGSKVLLRSADGRVKAFRVEMVEHTLRDRIADFNSDKLREALLRRPLNRYMPEALRVEAFEVGDAICEEWERIRCVANKERVNVYLQYTIRKDDDGAKSDNKAGTNEVQAGGAGPGGGAGLRRQSAGGAGGTSDEDG